MKKTSTLLAASIFALSAVPAIADSSLTANGGFVSEYYYRGVELGDAALNGGVDYESGGFSAGVWAIDDGGDVAEDGLEVDFYASYGFDLGGVGVSIGFTDYEYTYTSDKEVEINLGLSYGAFSLDLASGDDKNEEEVGDEDYDYDFYAVSWSGEVFGATVGAYDNDDDSDDDAAYKYAEISASGELNGLDVTALIGTKFNVEASGSQDDGYMVLSVSKSFDL